MTEIPTFSRCCFCLPLRRGLLVWSYLKIPINAVILVVMYFMLLQALIISALNFGDPDNFGPALRDLFLVIIGMAVLFTDLMAMIVYNIGGHKKKVKLVRVSYLMTQVVLVTSVVLLIILAAIYLAGAWPDINQQTIVIGSVTFFVDLVLHTYFLLLLRSIFIKLKINSEFRPINNNSKEECDMKCVEKVGENETEAVVV